MNWAWGRRVIWFVSRLHPEKGHIYLFEALAALRMESPNLSCYLVGKGPERKALEESADKLGIAQSIRFLGWRDDALTILAAADLVMHPSLHEALPSALIEALALFPGEVREPKGGASGNVSLCRCSTMRSPSENRSTSSLNVISIPPRTLRHIFKDIV